MEKSLFVLRMKNHPYLVLFVTHPKLFSFSFQGSSFNSFEDREITKGFSVVKF